MRMPLLKVYRAFPELDAFPDHECKRFVRRARRLVLKWMWVPIVGLVGGLALMFGLLVFVTSSFRNQLSDLARWLDRLVGGLIPVDYPVGDLVLAGAFLVLLTVVPWLAFVLPRDALLRRAIARRLEIANCTGCEHSLLGLPVLGGGGDPVVRCPECGREMVLREIGLTPEDLLVRDR